jgi:hypothetical protein
LSKAAFPLRRCEELSIINLLQKEIAYTNNYLIRTKVFFDEEFKWRIDKYLLLLAGQGSQKDILLDKNRVA